MRKISLFVILLLLSITGTSQTNIDQYDSHFLKRNSCFWEWTSWCRSCEFLLDTIPKMKKPPILKISYSGKYGHRNMYSSLSRQIRLPLGEYKKLSVSLVHKSRLVEGIDIHVIGIDDNEHISHDTKLNKKSSGKWQTSSMHLSAKGIRAINVQIAYNGTGNKDQAIWLRSISVKLDGKDINLMETAYHPADSILLPSSHIVPLTVGDSFLIPGKIADLKNIKAIGLGENTHGSISINAARIQFVKDLIRNHRCTLVLLEQPYAIGLISDLFVQGLIPLDWPELDGYLKLGLGNYQQTKELLIWLRNYNKKATSVVHVYGIDDSGPLFSNFMMEYYLALLGPKESKHYLRMLLKDNFNELFETTKNDLRLKKIIGDKAFSWHQKLLSNKNLYPKAEFQTKRDSSMYWRFLFLDSVFSKPDEKIAILAHAVHLQKIPEITVNGLSDVLGSLLSKRFGPQYASFGFVFGSGYFAQDSCSFLMETRIIMDSLRNIPPNSLEYAALQTGQEYFYYPSSFLSPSIQSMANILRFGRGDNPFVFSALKRRFDGYVFIRKSEGPTYYSNTPILTTPKFIQDRLDKFYLIAYENANTTP